jgi:crotonobetainyl-CoA:carnitine CoA-transferase CaiB-like acyl-CoA transferase
VEGPLAGTLVIEVCQSVAGPYATMILADLGARVIKVERPDGGDDTRRWGPPFWAGESTLFLAFNRNKESVVLDLKTPGGQETLRRLAARADVLVQNYRAGVLDRMGLGYEDLKQINPRLIYCSMTAYGDAGPLKEQPGYDPLLQAFSGLMSVTGEPGGAPVRSGTSVVDMGTGMWAALGVTSALLERQRTGQGRHVAVSLLDTSLAWLPYQALGYLATGRDPAPQGTGMSFLAPYQAYPTADGDLVIAAGNDSLWQKLCQALGRPELAWDLRFATNPDRVRSRQELYEALAELLKTEGAEAWSRRLTEAGVPCSPIHRVSEALAHPQVKAAGMLAAVPHPAVPDLQLVQCPLRLDGERLPVRSAPPLCGADTDAVLAELGPDDQ